MSGSAVKVLKGENTPYVRLMTLMTGTPFLQKKPLGRLEQMGCFPSPDLAHAHRKRKHKSLGQDARKTVPKSMSMSRCDVDIGTIWAFLRFDRHLQWLMSPG